MSQNYFPPSSSKARSDAPEGTAVNQHNEHFRPNYLTVGSGATSESANRLTEMLDDDSGYGSMVDGHLGERFNPAFSTDSPIGSPSRFGNLQHCMLWSFCSVRDMAKIV